MPSIVEYFRMQSQIFSMAPRGAMEKICDCIRKYSTIDGIVGFLAEHPDPPQL